MPGTVEISNWLAYASNAEILRQISEDVRTRIGVAGGLCSNYYSPGTNICRYIFSSDGLLESAEQVLNEVKSDYKELIIKVKNMSKSQTLNI